MPKSVSLVRNLPIWKFYYKGSHSKPVRTTIAVVSNTSKVVTGYVLRRGNDVTATLSNAKIHSFKKSEITSNPRTKKCSLTKYSLTDYLTNGA